MGLLQKLHEVKAAGNDGKLIPFGMGRIEMGLDLIHVTSRRNALYLINVSTIVQEGWRQHDKARVRAEVKGIHLVKPQESHKEANVGICQGIASQESLLLQDGIRSVKCFCKLVDGFVVCTLSLGESAAVVPGLTRDAARL